MAKSMNNQFFRVGSIVALLFLPSFSHVLLAQGTWVEVSPLAGLAVSGSDLFSWEGAYCITLGGLKCNHVLASGKQKAGFVGGARVSIWASPSFAVEAMFAFSQRDVETAQTTLAGDIFSERTIKTSVSAKNLYGGVKGTFGLNLATRATLLVGGGFGAVVRSGDAFEEGFGTTLIMGAPGSDVGLAGLAGLGLLVRVNDNISLRVDLEDFIHKTESIPGGSSASLASLFGTGEAPLQHDLLLAAGVSIRL